MVVVMVGVNPNLAYNYAYRALWVNSSALIHNAFYMDDLNIAEIFYLKGFQPQPC